METLWKLSKARILLHPVHFVNQRLTVSNRIKDIDKRILEKNDTLMTQNLLVEDEKHSSTDNKFVLEAY